MFVMALPTSLDSKFDLPNRPARCGESGEPTGRGVALRDPVRGESDAWRIAQPRP